MDDRNVKAVVQTFRLHITQNEEQSVKLQRAARDGDAVPTVLFEFHARAITCTLLLVYLYFEFQTTRISNNTFAPESQHHRRTSRADSRMCVPFLASTARALEHRYLYLCAGSFGTAVQSRPHLFLYFNFRTCTHARISTQHTPTRSGSSIRKVPSRARKTSSACPNPR